MPDLETDEQKFKFALNLIKPLETELLVKMKYGHEVPTYIPATKDKPAHYAFLPDRKTFADDWHALLLRRSFKEEFTK